MPNWLLVAVRNCLYRKYVTCSFNNRTNLTLTIKIFFSAYYLITLVKYLLEYTIKGSNFDNQIDNFTFKIWIITL